MRRKKIKSRPKTVISDRALCIKCVLCRFIILFLWQSISLWAVVCMHSISTHTHTHRPPNHNNNNNTETNNNNRLQYNYCTQSKWVVCDCNGPDNICIVLHYQKLSVSFASGNVVCYFIFLFISSN